MNTNPVNYNNGLVLYDNKPIYSAVSGGDWEYTPVDYNLVYHVDPDASGNYTQSSNTVAVVRYQTTAADPSPVYNCYADDYALVESGALVKNPRIVGEDPYHPSLIVDVPVPIATNNLKTNYILNNIGAPIANVLVLPFLQNGVPNSLPKSARCTYAIDYGNIDCTVVNSSGPYSIDGITVQPGCTAIRNVHMTGEQIRYMYNNQGDPPPRYSATHDYCNQIWENITWQTNRVSDYTSFPGSPGILLAGRHGNYSNSSVCQIKDEQLGYVIKNVNFTYSPHSDYQYIHDMRMSLNGVSSYCPVYVENYTGGLIVDVGSGDGYVSKPLSGYTFKGNNNFVLCNRSTDENYIGPPPSGFIDCKFIDTPTIRLQSLKEYANYQYYSGNGFNNISATNWTIQSNDSTNNKLILKNSRSHPFNLSGKAFILDGVHLEQGTEFYITNCSGTVHTLNGATYVGVYKV